MVEPRIKENRLFLFHLNTFNDIDHISPVIWKFLEKGDQVVAVFLSDYDFENDYRINFLETYPNFEVERISKLNRFRCRLFLNRYCRKICATYVIGKKVIYFLSNYIWPNKWLKNRQVAAAIYEWGGPGRLNFYETKQLGIPTIVLPHGFNIFENLDPTEKIRADRKQTGKWPDFSNRSQFDMYILQTRRHLGQCLVFGMDQDKTQAWGSARFYPEWSKKNLELCGVFHPKKDDKGKLKVVFFLPHWAYNVLEEDVLALLGRTASLPFVYLVVKGHTRGTGSLGDDWASKLSAKPNVEVNVPAHSPALVRWCDVVVNFGSSIAIEALNQGKSIIHTPYLHTNQTIFDDGKVAHVAKDLADVIKFLEMATKGDLQTIESNEKDAFMYREIYAEKKPLDVLEFYHQMISKICLSYKL